MGDHLDDAYFEWFFRNHFGPNDPRDPGHSINARRAAAGFPPIDEREPEWNGLFKQHQPPAIRYPWYEGQDPTKGKLYGVAIQSPIEDIEFEMV